MAIENVEAPPTRPASKWLFPLAWLLLLAGIGVYLVQFLVLKQYVVPWYAPILSTVGLVLMLVAIWQRRSVCRIVGLVVFGLLLAFQWIFLLGTSAPPYAGPAAGKDFPAFAAQRADGSPFTEKDLAGQSTVVLFYRGHW